MYTIESLRRRISKEGAEQVIRELSSLSNDNMKKQLEDSGILVNGYPNLTLILSI